MLLHHIPKEFLSKDYFSKEFNKRAPTSIPYKTLIYGLEVIGHVPETQPTCL